MHEHQLDEALYYFGFASSFGWTPEQVDDQRATLIDGMATIAELRAQVAAEQRRSPGG